MSAEQEMTCLFLDEAQASLADLDAAFTKLQSTPDSKEIIQSIFKVFHRIGGVSHHLGFTALHSISRAGEKVVEGLRTDKIAYSPELSLALFSTVEMIREQLREVQQTGGENVVRDELEALLAELGSLVRDSE